MGRHEQREQVFRLLFQAEFHPAQDMPRQMRLFVEDNEEIGSQKDADYIEKRCQTVFRELPGIDRLIDENTVGWNTRRMGKVGLAKLYGQENAGGFVNAILAKIVKLPRTESARELLKSGD